MFQGKPALPAAPSKSAQAGLFTAFLLLFIVCTRWATAPRQLYYFDSANFALSLEHFDPALHQPQPPGYPLFVLLIRVIHLWIPNAEQVMLVAGLLAAAAGTLLIRELATDLFDRQAGTLAATLFASNPVVWFAGVTNQIRLFLALAAITISLLAWRALRNPGDGRWLLGAFAALGIAAGFRPVESTLLVPLLVWVWWRNGHNWVRLGAGVGLLAATSLPWIAATVIAAGGPHATIAMLWDYAHAQFSGTSAVFGATAASAWLMFKEALVWNLLGLIAWIWAVPHVMRWCCLPAYRDHAVFLSIGFLPAFLFSAFIHIGDPDQALASVAILCAVGSGVLSAFLRQTRSNPGPLIAAVLAINTILFFVPFNKLAKASSYKAVAAVDRMNSNALNAIRTLRGDRRITIVDFGSSVASRQLEYYFPDDYVVVLPGNPRHPLPGETVQMFYHHAGLNAVRSASGRMPPHSRRLVALLPFQSRSSDLPGWHPYGPVYYTDLISAAPLHIGPYTLIPDAP